MKTSCSILWVASGLILSIPVLAQEAQVLRATAMQDRADFDVYLPLQRRDQLDQLIGEQNREGSASYHHWLTTEEFAAQFGPDEATLTRVKRELAAHGFTVAGSFAQGLHVKATAAQVQAAFKVHLNDARFHDGGIKPVADRPLQLPQVLAESGSFIPSFSAGDHFRTHSVWSSPKTNNYISPTGAYWTADLRQAYDFPAATSITGAGVNIGILMGSAIQTSDLAGFFSFQHIPAALYPTLTTIPIDGGTAFNPTSDNSEEATLDVEHSAGMALATNEILYNVGNWSDSTIMTALNFIVASNHVDILSMSFGLGEACLLYPQYGGGSSGTAYINTMHNLFAEGTSKGITFIASSGDWSAVPSCANRQVLTPQYPASDPYVTAVGGTNLRTFYAAGNANSNYVGESAYKYYMPNQQGAYWGSGGGISYVFSKPTYQTWVPTQSSQKRTVPDIALNMGTPGVESGDNIFINGQPSAIYGTSAAAPEIAGLAALKKKLVGSRLGLLNTYIYTRAYYQNHGSGTPFYHRYIAGNNYYAVQAPYDLVIGNGTVDARQFLQATNLPAAGTPYLTSGNP